MQRFFRLSSFLVLVGFLLLYPRAGVAADPSPIWTLRDVEEISDVWNGVVVGFGFIARDDAVYVGFYDYDRNMTIGRREYAGVGWELKKLPTQIGWDSHNSIAMTFDADDYLHVSGNMHASPLNYFRATRPNDVESLERVERMTGELENRTTYPSFMRDKSNRLIFTYRDGASGNGDQIWNVYDEKTRSWSRLLDKPLFDGEGRMNAYFTGPVLARDGAFHVAWVWRDTPDCATNHDLSYARSPDLIRWEKSDGTPLELPITFATGERVAAIPSGGGLLNPLVRLSFDEESRPMIVYTKYDKNGKLQIHLARLENKVWKTVQATDWDLAWHFSGGGSIDSQLFFDAARVVAPDRVAIDWTRVDGERRRGTIFLDAKTLEPREAPVATSAPTVSARPEYAPDVNAALVRVESDDPRLLPRSRTLDLPTGERWVFRWEAPAPNRDRPQPDGAPKATKLRVYQFVKTDAAN